MTFVLTGVYDSLEREEMGEIIKKCGGKVTTGVSKNTAYLVVGEQAGESKLDKARKIGTKFLTEDEFLKLIVEKSDGKPVKEKENKTPSPKKKEEKSVKAKTIKDEPMSQEKKPTIKSEPASKSPLKAKSEVRMPKIPKIEPSETKVNCFMFYM